MTTSRRAIHRDRLRVGCSAAAGALMLTLYAPGSVLADSVDGVFPTAEEVGGEVFPEGLKVGDAFPTDWEIYDDHGKKTDVGKLIKGKRTVLAFFISAVPVSVQELKKLEKVHNGSSKTQLLFVNTDLVGAGLLGGNRVDETARTVRVIQREEKLNNRMFVAPNDALDPAGLSNKLGFRGLPTVYVVDADGRVENVYVGPQNWSDTNI